MLEAYNHSNLFKTARDVYKGYKTFQELAKVAKYFRINW